MLFRLTRKAGDKLRVQAATVPATVPSLVEWYCNVVTAQRRQLFLFTQATTLFSFWVPISDIRREEFGRGFRLHAGDALREYGFVESDLSKIIDAGPDVFAACVDLGVLGSMVDYAKMLQFVVQDRGGLEMLDRRAMNDIANECPMSKIGMNFPVEHLRDVLRTVGAA